MRLLVISDTHGRSDLFFRAIESEPEARDVIFLGDGLRECEEAQDRYPDRRFHMVRGNCDWYAGNAPALGDEMFGGKCVVFMHGHIQNVKFGPEVAIETARDRGADLLLYGHTHTACTDYEDGLYILNPGSLGYEQQYGIADITAGGIFTDVRRLRV